MLVHTAARPGVEGHYIVAFKPKRTSYGKGGSTKYKHLSVHKTEDEANEHARSLSQKHGYNFNG